MVIKKIYNILFCFVSFIFIFCSLVFSVFFFYGKDLPSELTLLDYAPPTTTQIFSASDDLMEEYGIEHRIIVAFNKISSIVKGAFIIAEDKDFYKHSGLSLQSLIRAIVENTARKSWNKKPAGGSTITQQVAKNLLVGNTRNISRKIKEAIMAFRIESSIPKDKIMEIYLNHLYLGKGCYGVNEACRYYFDKPLEDILPHEAAFLATIPSAPTIYVNERNTSKIINKRNTILYQMFEFGYITEDELKYALKAPIKLKLKKRKFTAPFFSDEIFRIFSQQISSSTFLSNGYKIKTTMDKKIQSIATKVLEDGLIEYTKHKAWNGTLGNIKTHDLSKIEKKLPRTANFIIPVQVLAINGKVITFQDKNHLQLKVNLSEKFYKDANLKLGDIVLLRKNSELEFELYQQPEITGGIIVMDSRSGDVLALCGGYSFDISPFNCITQAKRQPGSTIKPFVYAAALENGMEEFDTINDKVVNFKLEDGKPYVPHNYNMRTYGKTPLRDGLIYSRNLSTIDVALKTGLKKVSDFLNKFHLAQGKLPISGVLGSVEVIPFNLLKAFSSFDNDGVMVEPKFIKNIYGNFSPSLENRINEFFKITQGPQIISKKTANIIKSILRESTKTGTSSGLSTLEDDFNIKIFGKTGTTNNFKDAWFIGGIEDCDTNNKYLVCIFIGYQIPKSLGEHCSGAKVALPIFKNFIQQLKISS